MDEKLHVIERKYFKEFEIFFEEVVKPSLLDISKEGNEVTLQHIFCAAASVITLVEEYLPRAIKSSGYKHMGFYNLKHHLMEIPKYQIHSRYGSPNKGFIWKEWMEFSGCPMYLTKLIRNSLVHFKTYKPGTEGKGLHVINDQIGTLVFKQGDRSYPLNWQIRNAIAGADDIFFSIFGEGLLNIQQRGSCGQSWDYSGHIKDLRIAPHKSMGENK